MVTSAADLGDHQTKPNNAYLPLHDIPFWKCQTKDIAMVTSAASNKLVFSYYVVQRSLLVDIQFITGPFELMDAI